MLKNQNIYAIPFKNFTAHFENDLTNMEYVTSCNSCIIEFIKGVREKR